MTTYKTLSRERSNDLAWAAGLFDGEGSVHLQENKYLELGLGQNDTIVLKRLQKVLGGKIYGPYREKNYKWTVFGKKALPVLGKLLPYLSWPKKKKLFYVFSRCQKWTR